MERGKSTDFILKQFKKKSKRVVKKDLFTEFFYLNRERRVVEFLKHGDELAMDVFFKEFIPSEFRPFVQVKAYNDMEEEITTWFYDEENLVILIEVNWGNKKQEISVDIDIESFAVSIVDQNQQLTRSVDYIMFNDYLISFLTLQARNLAETFDVLAQKRREEEASPQ